MLVGALASVLALSPKRLQKTLTIFTDNEGKQTYKLNNLFTTCCDK